MVAVDANGNVVGSLTATASTATATSGRMRQAIRPRTHCISPMNGSSPTGCASDLGARWEKVDINGQTELKQTVNLDDGKPRRFANHHGKGQFASWDYSSASLAGHSARTTSSTITPGCSRAGHRLSVAERQHLHDQPDSDRHHADDGSRRGRYKYATAFRFYATGVLHQYDTSLFSNYVFQPHTGCIDAAAGLRQHQDLRPRVEGGVYPVDC